MCHDVLYRYRVFTERGAMGMAGVGATGENLQVGASRGFEQDQLIVMSTGLVRLAQLPDSCTFVSAR